MKKAVFETCFICFVLLACNNINKGENNGSASASDTLSEIVKADTSVPAFIVKDSSLKKVDTDSAFGRIFGTWAFVGDENENASFVIEKDKIFYPDQNKSFKYSIKRDSIEIRYDGYNGSYLINMRGPDTLILAGDEKQVYFRIKK